MLDTLSMLKHVSTFADASGDRVRRSMNAIQSKLGPDSERSDAQTH